MSRSRSETDSVMLKREPVWASKSLVTHMARTLRRLEMGRVHHTSALRRSQPRVKLCRSLRMRRRSNVRACTTTNTTNASRSGAMNTMVVLPAITMIQCPILARNPTHPRETCSRHKIRRGWRIRRHCLVKSWMARRVSCSRKPLLVDAGSPFAGPLHGGYRHSC